MNWIFILLFALSLAVLAGYVAYAAWRCGVPASLSETYYLLKNQGRKGWIFSVCLTVAALGIMPAWIEASTENTQFLAFLSAAALAFVAYSPAFGEPVTGNVHKGATVVAALSGVAWCCVAFPLSWIVPVSCVVAIVYPIVKSPRKWLFWAEMAAFASVYVSLLVKMIIG